MTIQDLPALNATLNGLSTILLLAARWAIANKRISQHRALMLAAFGTSVIFLVSYLVYHFNAGVIYFSGTGFVRMLYFILLTSHTILAVTVPVLAVITLKRGLAGTYDLHKKIARWTYPIWLYVSATGVLVYLMLYQWYPGAH